MLVDLFDGSIKLNLLASDAFEPGFHKFLVHVDRSHRPKHLARLARLDGNGEMRLGDLAAWTRRPPGLWLRVPRGGLSALICLRFARVSGTANFLGRR